MTKVVVRKTEEEGIYSGEAGEFRISIDRTQNRSPRSIDLVLLGLGACTISTVGHYLNRKGLPPDSVEVELSADFEEKEGIYKNLKVLLKVDDRIPPEIRKVVAGIARNCRIHRTLEAAPHISIELAENSGAAVS